MNDLSDIIPIAERVLVCGGRRYNNKNRVFDVLDSLSPAPAVIIHGGATGADSLASEWAEKNNIVEQTYYADWTRYGYVAGPIRNKYMLENGKPTLVIAFPGGSGTENMIKQSQMVGVRVVRIKD